MLRYPFSGIFWISDQLGLSHLFFIEIRGVMDKINGFF